MKLFLYHGGPEPFPQQDVPQLGLDVGRVTLANHVERGPARTETGKAGGLLKGKRHLFLFLADLVGRDLALHATAASSDIFQGNLHG